MKLSSSCFLMATLSLVLTFPATMIAAEPKTLSSEDKTFLDGLLKDLLFDPVGAERVTVNVIERTVWAKEEKKTADGWLKAEAGRPARVYFADGESMPAPKPDEMKKVDFVRDYAIRGESDLVAAAWLHRLGHDDLAADCFDRVRNNKEKLTEQLRHRFAWSAFAGMVHAFMVRADEEALQHGEHLLHHYPKEAAKYRQSKDIVADLKRRQQKGTFGKTPPKDWPAGFDKWEPKKKAAYLIDSLDEVDARQWGQPGGVDLARDRRVQALINLGEAAVPGLIDTIEKDHRLTRSVHFWRDFAEGRTVMAVREAALVAAMSIMQVEAFRAEATGDDFTAHGDEAAIKVAARLRDYWKKYAGVPFDERMMKILTDPKSDPKSLREAAENLARGQRRMRGTTINFQFSRPPTGPNPAIAKFNNPTAAEAILAAMDRDLAAFDSAKPEQPGTDRTSRERRMQMQLRMMTMGGGGDLRDFERQQIENSYIHALTMLNDKRIAPAIATKAEKASSPRMRRHLAIVALQLGDADPFKKYADDFRQGNIKLPPDKRPEGGFGLSSAAAELQNMVQDLIAVGTPEADRALMAMADPGHLYHERAATAVLNANVHGWGDNVWFRHRVSLALLRDLLSEKNQTGATYQVEGDTLKRSDDRGGSSSGPLPNHLADASKRKDAAPERICDVAAEKISELVFGVPPYHPLFKDADARLKALREAMDRYSYRPATAAEVEALAGQMEHDPGFVPDIQPLGRPATADDVRAGKAIFHLDGKGKLADAKLPLEAVLKSAGEAPSDQESRHRGRPGKVGGVLIVQAEVDAAGKLKYGVIMSHELRTLAADDLKDVKPLPIYYTETFFAR